MSLYGDWSEPGGSHLLPMGADPPPKAPRNITTPVRSAPNFPSRFHGNKSLAAQSMSLNGGAARTFPLSDLIGSSPTIAAAVNAVQDEIATSGAELCTPALAAAIQALRSSMGTHFSSSVLTSHVSALDHSILPKFTAILAAYLAKPSASPAGEGPYSSSTPIDDLASDVLYCLTNIGAGESHMTKLLVRHGIVPLAIRAVLSIDRPPMVIENALWVLGNIAGDGAIPRDEVMRHGGLDAVIARTAIELARLGYAPFAEMRVTSAHEQQQQQQESVPSSGASGALQRRYAPSEFVLAAYPAARAAATGAVARRGELLTTSTSGSASTLDTSVTAVAIATAAANLRHGSRSASPSTFTSAAGGSGGGGGSTAGSAPGVGGASTASGGSDDPADALVSLALRLDYANDLLVGRRARETAAAAAALAAIESSSNGTVEEDTAACDVVGVSESSSAAAVTTLVRASTPPTTALTTLTSNRAPLSSDLLKIATWTISNVCEFQPRPDLPLGLLLPVLSACLDCPDPEVLSHVAWALSHVCDGPPDGIYGVLCSSRTVKRPRAQEGVLGLLPYLLKAIRHAAAKAVAAVAGGGAAGEANDQTSTSGAAVAPDVDVEDDDSAAGGSDSAAAAASAAALLLDAGGAAVGLTEAPFPAAAAHPTNSTSLAISAAAAAAAAGEHGKDRSSGRGSSSSSVPLLFSPTAIRAAALIVVGPWEPLIYAPAQDAEIVAEPAPGCDPAAAAAQAPISSSSSSSSWATSSVSSRAAGGSEGNADATALTSTCDAPAGYPPTTSTLFLPSVAAKLARLLKHSSSRIVKPSLRAIGNIVCAEDERDYTQAVVDLGIVPLLQRLIESAGRELQKEACWTVSNVAAGSPAQVQAVLSSGCIPPVLSFCANPLSDSGERATDAHDVECTQNL